MHDLSLLLSNQIFSPFSYLARFLQCGSNQILKDYATSPFST